MKSKVFVTSLICILAISIVVIFTINAQAAQPKEQEIITVRQGDTLWSIAQAHRGKTEIRKYIYNLQKLNDIDSNIVPGQELLLP